jgi:pyruvate-ferredoxin/flavodoxin oxidoreductase
VVLKAGCPISAQLKAVADNLVRKFVWILGGDGWAYDIGATACAPSGSPSAS